VLAQHFTAGGDVVTEARINEIAGRFSLLYPPFLLGLITGGAIIYWFSSGRLDAGGLDSALRAVEFIKANIKLDTGATKASHRRLEEGGRDLHPVRAAGHAQHLPQHLLSTSRSRA